jgi:cell division protein YceG involved in septum cleavage
MESVKTMKLSLGLVVAIVAQSFGAIWYMAQLDQTVDSTAGAVASLEVTIGEMESQIGELEKKDVLIENEMRTIMADHQSFTEVLRSIGIAGYGDSRKYGSYD